MEKRLTMSKRSKGQLKFKQIKHYMTKSSSADLVIGPVITG